MPPYTLKPANESDYEILKDIHHTTMEQHVSKIWGWDKEFQDRYYRENFNPQNIQLIYSDKNLTGYLQSWESENKISLVNILILPDYQKYGLGTSIIKSLQNLAIKKSKPLELGVFKINTNAKRLYEKLGFEVFEETKTHFLMRYRGNLCFEKANLNNLSTIHRIYPGDDSKFWIDFNWYWLGVRQRRADIDSYIVTLTWLPKTVPPKMLEA